MQSADENKQKETKSAANEWRSSMERFHEKNSLRETPRRPGHDYQSLEIVTPHTAPRSCVKTFLDDFTNKKKRKKITLRERFFT